MQDRAAGSTVSHLNVEDVYKIVLGELPSLAKQRAIAEVLGALDDKIEANDRTGSFCDLMIEVAFRVIEDVEGVAAIPLFDLVDFTFGEPFSSEQFNDTGEGRPLVRIRDLKTFRPQVWTTESRPNETVIDPGDVVIGMDAEFRATFWLGLRGLLNQRVCLARTGIGSPALVREILRAPLALVEGYKTGTTVSHLNKSDLAAIRVARPSASAVEAFSAMAEPLRQAIVGLAAESRTLVSLRDALLPKLLSGELRVRDAETLVEEAV
jgi:type I restriction enzyme S subunit